MTFKMRPLDFRYQGEGVLTAVALGAVYTIEARDGGTFQAHVLGVSLGNGSLETCAGRCQHHFETAVYDLIEPDAPIAA